LVNDEKGKKMSKSKGNVVNPLDLTAKYGTDALRMALIVGNTPGTSLALAENKIKAYKHFANKLWNITRFVMENNTETPADSPKGVLGVENRALIDQFEALIPDITKDMNEYRFYLAAEKLYAYVWHTFADVIIEESKDVIYKGSAEDKTARISTLHSILKSCLKMLHPFMPFITEELWSLVNGTQTEDINTLLMVSRWPTV
jgi:valyl-tRNA synthetase